MAIVNGQKPGEQNYILSQMRRHLCGCLEDKLMRHFPAKHSEHTRKDIQAKKSKTTVIAGNKKHC